MKQLLLTLLILLTLNLFAQKDSIDFERINRIENLSKGLYNKLHPTQCTKPGDDFRVTFENNKMPLNEEQFIDNSRLLESEIPMQYNSEVHKLINYFGTSWQSKLKEMIVVSNYYFPIYEEIFDKYDLPLEMKYLSVIESALNPHATSKCGAAGLWQFMPYTGAYFGLKNNYFIDERRSIEKSTEAACQYLKSMYNIYEDWNIVIASYNCGPGNINKAIRKAGGGKQTFWEIYPYLPRETQNYVPALIAMTYLMNFHQTYGITPSVAVQTKSRLVKVVCNSEYCYEVICSTLDISADELRSFNPELKKASLPSVKTTFNLKLPYDKALMFWQLEDSIKHKSLLWVKKFNKTHKIYTVKKGDGLGKIADKYDCTIIEIKKWNKMKSNMIKPGQKLKILS